MSSHDHGTPALSLTRNITASYVSQAYQVLVGLAIVPVYIHYMGSEAYGLIGFYTVLQTLFQLLDLGLSPTMSREAARFNGGGTNPEVLRALLKALAWFFGVAGALVAGVILLSANLIAVRWLHVQHLSIDSVRHSVMLISGVVFAQWMCGLYRGVITGFERLVWLSAFNVAISTLRYIGVVLVFAFVGVAPELFFTYQLIVAVLGLGVLAAFAYSLLPRVDAHKASGLRWRELKPTLRFSMMIAFTGGVWVIMSQTDKLLLSKLLPLAEYGYYTVAVQAASGVMLASGPVSIALLPRLTKLVATSDVPRYERVYRGATQLICAVSVSVSTVMALFSKQLLWAWTGNESLAQSVALVLTLYAIGNGVLSISAFPYYLQYAKGDLKLHVIGNILFLLFEIPGIVILTREYGMLGASSVWVCANLLYFLLWVPLVHHRLAPGLHRSWLIRDIALVAAPVVAFPLAMKALLPLAESRAVVGAELAAIGGCTAAIAVVASPVLRSIAKENFVKYWKRLMA